MSHTDKFWKLFWIVVGIFVLLYFVVVVGLSYFYNPTQMADAAAVGVVFDSSRDPFATKRPDDNRPKFTGEYFYDDALPPAFADWSWGVKINWNSSETYYDGLQSFKISFLQDWSGMRVNASDIDLTEYQGISLLVYPKGTIEDLHIQLFDSRGNPLGQQSLSWYAPGGKLSPDTWNHLSIPFENLFPANQEKRPISGYAISTVHPGTIYIDSVRLLRSIAPHSRWYEPKPIQFEFQEEVEKPDPPISLPYSLNLTPQGSQQWKTIFGRFELAANGIRIGSTPEKTTGSMSYIRGGQNWTDYSVDTRAYWGQTSSFSILVRYVDDANFVSCAFSNYNEIAQLYSVKKGVSTLIGTSPGLPIRKYEPWKDAKAGATVRGNRVSCYVDGERALTAEIPDIAPQGSGGIETWTRNTYDSPHTLQEFSVKPL
jgi:hypothetical protein